MLGPQPRPADDSIDGVPPAGWQRIPSRSVGPAKGDRRDTVAMGDRRARRVLRRETRAPDGDQPRLPLHVHVLRSGHHLVYQGPQLRQGPHPRRIRVRCPAYSRGVSFDGHAANRRFELRHVRAGHRAVGLSGRNAEEVRLADVHRCHHGKEPRRPDHQIGRKSQRRPGAVPGRAVARRQCAAQRQTQAPSSSKPTNRS